MAETQPTTSVNDDPFADDEADNPFAADDGSGMDVSDEIGTEPVTAAPEAEIPVVDKEGQPVAGPLETTPEDRGEEVSEARVAAAEADAHDEPPEEGIEGAQEGGTPESEAQPPVEPEEAASAPAAPPQPPVVAPAAAGDGQPDAAGGKSQVRYYQVLVQTGPNQWSVADLKGAKDNGNNNIVSVDGEDGLWLAARNNEHALRLSWALIDRPSGGATIMPVPRGAWKPKRVKPKVVPEREQLDIS